MTSAQMLSRLRFLLDEATASFWADADLYTMLSDGQREVANFGMTKFISTPYQLRTSVGLILEPLVVVQTSATNVTTGEIFVSLPTGFWYDLSVKYYTTPSATLVPLLKRQKEANLTHIEANSYFAATENVSMYYYIDMVNSMLMFSNAASTPNGVYMMNYIKIPTEISGAIEPILLAFTHEAILQYAYTQALLRDNKTQEAQVEYAKFVNLVQGLP